MDANPWDYLSNRFGIEKRLLDNYELVENSGDIWIVSTGIEDYEKLEVETYGIRFLRITGRGMKPTTYGLQLIENSIERNIVEVDKDELKLLLARKEMIPRDLEEDGYVAIKYEENIIGCGFYKENVVSSRIPKGRSKELLKIIEGE